MIYSYSSISTYLQCPRRFEQQYKLRRWRDSGSDASRWGERIHKALEDYLNGVTPEVPRQREVPSDGLLPMLRGANARAEQALAVTADGEPCDFWSKLAHFRGKLDVVLLAPGHVFVIDWKTGKRRDNTLQARSYAYLASVHYPWCKVTITFDYLDKGRDAPMQRDPTEDTRHIRALLAMADADRAYIPRPTPLCGWCPVEDCEYWERRR